MERGPLTNDEIVGLEKISDLAEQICALAAPLDKYPRHPISDASNLIRWICYDYRQPHDAEAGAAIQTLRNALCRAGDRTAAR